ncbi:MAG: hypothetical protein QOI86_3918 [Actinomycetota bacterium]|nr:hypothetical protein [Actinomycetota bacterium]
MNRTSVGRSGVVLLALTLGGVACSSGGKDKSAESTAAPESLRAPAAEVTAGLGKIGALVAQIGLATAADAKAATDLVKGIEPAWQPIEGTLRANDKDLYLRFEDDFAALKKAAAAGDGTKAQQTSADVADAMKAYLARFPG